MFKYLDFTYITLKIEAIDSLSCFPIVNLLHFFLFYFSYITKPEQPQITITKKEVLFTSRGKLQKEETLLLPELKLYREPMYILYKCHNSPKEDTPSHPRTPICYPPPFKL